MLTLSVNSLSITLSVNSRESNSECELSESNSECWFGSDEESQHWRLPGGGQEGNGQRPEERARRYSLITISIVFITIYYLIFRRIFESLHFKTFYLYTCNLIKTFKTCYPYFILR